MTKKGADYLASSPDTAKWLVLWDVNSGCIKEIPFVGGK